ncbi:hypothetical protein AAG906_038456 [Vitis piasezkii]
MSKPVKAEHPGPSSTKIVYQVKTHETHEFLVSKIDLVAYVSCDDDLIHVKLTIDMPILKISSIVGRCSQVFHDIDDYIIESTLWSHSVL